MKVCKNCNAISFSDLEKRILQRLKKGKTVSERELSEKLDVSLTAVYNSVKALEKARLVRTKKIAARHGMQKVVWLQS